MKTTTKKTKTATVEITPEATTVQEVQTMQPIAKNGKLNFSKEKLLDAFDKEGIDYKENDKIFFDVVFVHSKFHKEKRPAILLKGRFVGNIYHFDGVELPFNTIKLTEEGIERILNCQEYNGYTLSHFWFKEIRYVKNCEHRRSVLITKPMEKGLVLGSAFTSTRQ